MRNQDKPINPCVMQQISDNGFRASKEGDPKKYRFPTEGLTKLEYASIQAMNGMLSDYELIQDVKISNPEYKDLPFHEGIAKASIKIADELLKQLENNK